MYLKNVTPSTMRCHIGACPAVYLSQSDVVIIGKRQPTVAARLAMKKKVAPDEEVVVIPASYFDTLVKLLNKDEKPKRQKK